jgi:hypothetical protein
MLIGHFWIPLSGRTTEPYLLPCKSKSWYSGPAWCLPDFCAGIFCPLSSGRTSALVRSSVAPRIVAGIRRRGRAVVGDGKKQLGT